MRLTTKQIAGLKVLLHLAGFLPLPWLLWAMQHGGSDTDPGENIQHFTGIITLKFLLATLLVSPLAHYAKQPLLFHTRRLLGLWYFTWATLHITSCVLLELGIQDLGLLGRELVSRPWLMLGMSSWIILFLLTLTSTQAAQRKVDKHWRTLRNYVYLTAILLPLHYLWSVKVLSSLPIIHAICLVVLLAFRYKKLLRKTGYKGVFMKSE